MGVSQDALNDLQVRKCMLLCKEPCVVFGCQTTVVIVSLVMHICFLCALKCNCPDSPSSSVLHQLPASLSMGAEEMWWTRILYSITQIGCYDRKSARWFKQNKTIIWHCTSSLQGQEWIQFLQRSQSFLWTQKFLWEHSYCWKNWTEKWNNSEKYVKCI